MRTQVNIVNVYADPARDQLEPQAGSAGTPHPIHNEGSGGGLQMRNVWCI